MLFALINAAGITRQPARAGLAPVNLAISPANLTIIILSLALLVMAAVMILLLSARRSAGAVEKSGRPDAGRTESQPASPASAGQTIPAADDPVLVAVISAAIAAFNEGQSSRPPESTAGFIVRRVRRV